MASHLQAAADAIAGAVVGSGDLGKQRRADVYPVGLMSEGLTALQLRLRALGDQRLYLSSVHSDPGFEFDPKGQRMRSLSRVSGPDQGADSISRAVQRRQGERVGPARPPRSPQLATLLPYCRIVLQSPAIALSQCLPTL